MQSVNYESVNTLEPEVASPPLAPEELSYDLKRQTKTRGYLSQVLLTSAPLMAADLLATMGSCILSLALLGSMSLSIEFDLLSLLPLHALVLLVVYAMWGLYPGSGLSPIFELRQTTVGTTMAFGVFLVASLAMHHSKMLAIMLAMAWALSMMAVPVMRSLFRKFFSRFQWWGQPVLIFGGRTTGVLKYEHLASRPYFGLRPVGVVDDLGLYPTEDVQSTPAYLGTFDVAPEIARDKGVFWAVVAMPERSSSEVNHIIKEHVNHFPFMLVVRDMDGLPSLWNRTFDFGGLNGTRIESNLLLPIPRVLKRIADVAIVTLVGICFLPLIAIIASLIHLSSPGPIIFRHERIGFNGRRFKALKFRTMLVNGPEILKEHLAANPEARKEWEETQKLKKDPRITGIGSFLRKTSLDELPQLWNILVGDMSLVGPRPIVQEEIEKYDDSFALYTQVIPGLTGLWQVSGRNNTTYAERVSFDNYYVRNWSPWMDIYILVKTVKVVLLREGAY